MALRAIVLQAGQCVVLPSSATVTGIIQDGDGIATSTCGSLPTPTGYTCYLFNWEDDDSGALQDAVFQYLEVGGNRYMVPSSYAGVNNSGSFSLGTWISTDPQLEGIVVLGCEQHSSDHLVKIQIPAGLTAPILKLSNPFASTTTEYYIYGTQDISDPDCESCV